MQAGSLTAIRSLFPLSSHLAYLNHAGMGPPSLVSASRAKEVIDHQSRQGSLGNPIWQGWLASARERAARLIGASAEEISFMKNTPEAISVVASGLRWREGDNVVVPRCEFPANVYPWMNLEERGVHIRWVEAPTGTFTVDDLANAVDDRTRLVAVSWVQFFSGFRVDIEAVGDMCRQKGVHLLVDAIQGLGVVPLDVRRAGIDFLATASHKWLLAPMGAGWLYCRHELVDELDLTEVGQSTVVPLGTYLEHRFEPKPDARRFEAGVPAYASIAGLDGALEVLETLGVANVHERVEALCDRLIEGLRERDCQLLTPAEPDRRAGIVTFRHPEKTSGELERALGEVDVVVVNRENAIRASPHFTNTPDHIDRLLDGL